MRYPESVLANRKRSDNLALMCNGSMEMVGEYLSFKDLYSVYRTCRFCRDAVWKRYKKVQIDYWVDLLEQREKAGKKARWEAILYYGY